MKSSLLRLFQTAFLAFFCYLVVFGFLNLAIINQIDQSTGQAAQGAEIRRRLATLRSLVLTAESSLRGYLYTERREYMISTSDQQLEIDRILQELDELVTDSSQIRRLNALKPRVTQKLEIIQESLRFSTSGDKQGAKNLVVSGVGKKLMDDITTLVDEMQDAEQSSIETSRNETNKMIRWLNFLIAAGLVGFALFSLGSYRNVAIRFLPLNALVERASMISEGNITGQPLTVGVRDEIGIVTEAYNGMLLGLRRIFARTEEAEQKIREISGRLARSSAEQASSSVQQSTAVQETAVTLEELSQSADQIAERASEVGGESRATAGESRRGLEAVQEAIRLSEKSRQGVEDVATTIVALSQKAEALEAIVSSVNELAERSNILSINAAIQAAAAGSEGVTFTVLANEMRLLANRSKEATVEVKGSLQEIRGGIHKAVMLAEEAVKRSESGDKNSRRTEETIRTMVDSFKKGDDAFQQIVAATRQQSHAFKQVEEALVSIQESAAQAEKGSRELERDSQELLQLSQGLTTTLNRYESNSDKGHEL